MWGDTERKAMREEGDIRMLRSFWQLGPECAGQCMQTGRGGFKGHRINLSINQYQGSLISGSTRGLTSLL